MLFYGCFVIYELCSLLMNTLLFSNLCYYKWWWKWTCLYIHMYIYVCHFSCVLQDKFLHVDLLAQRIRTFIISLGIVNCPWRGVILICMYIFILIACFSTLLPTQWLYQVFNLCQSESEKMVSQCNFNLHLLMERKKMYANFFLGQRAAKLRGPIIWPLILSLESVAGQHWSSEIKNMATCPDLRWKEKSVGLISSIFALTESLMMSLEG